MFFLAEGAWERPGLPGLLACFSWGPWSWGKDPDATSPSDPAQGECVAFLASWTLRGAWGYGHVHTGDHKDGVAHHRRRRCLVRDVGMSNVRCLDPQAAGTQAGSAGLSPQESLPREGVVGGPGRQLPDVGDGAPGAKRIVSPEDPGSL